MSTEIIRLLVLILVFAATILGIEGAVSWIRSTRLERNIVGRRLGLVERRNDKKGAALELRRETAAPLFHGTPLEGLLKGYDRILRESGLRVSSTQAFLRMMAAAIIIAMLLLALAIARNFALSLGGLTMIILFAGALGIGLPMMLLSRRQLKRKKLLLEQFPVALDIFVRGLRAGHPVSSALELLATDMSDPIAGEFRIVIDEVTYGLDLRDALENMANRCGLEDMHMFVVSLSVQSETGGNLAEILEGLSGVIRSRAGLLLKVRALSSEGRMTATMLTALPVLTFCGLFALNPKFYLDVADDRAFFPGFGALFVLYLIGVMIIRRMVDLKV